MRPRALLLLTLSAALLLPWAGWQLVRQTEALLRQGQESAQRAGAAALARALVASAPQSLPPAAPGLFVHAATRLPLIDGAADEYTELERARSVDGRLSLVLVEQAAALYAVIEVVDGTRRRADAADPLGRAGDAVELTLADARGTRRWRLANAAPGALQVAGSSDAALAPVGEWQETADGYRIELRLPRPEGAAAMAVAALDRDGAGVRTLPLAAAVGDLQPLLRRDAQLDAVLVSLAPPGARLRVVSVDGWVLGSAGRLGDDRDDDAGAARGDRAQSLLYRWLLAPPPEVGVGEFDAEGARLQAPVVWQALSGVAASSVRAASGIDAAIVAAAVPLGGGDAPRGALLLELPSDALLVLANRAVFGVIGGQPRRGAAGRAGAVRLCRRAQPAHPSPARCRGHAHCAPMAGSIRACRTSRPPTTSVIFRAASPDCWARSAPTTTTCAPSRASSRTSSRRRWRSCAVRSTISTRSSSRPARAPTRSARAKAPSACPASCVRWPRRAGWSVSSPAPRARTWISPTSCAAAPRPTATWSRRGASRSTCPPGASACTARRS